MHDPNLRAEIASLIGKDADELSALLAQSAGDELYSFDAAKAKGEAMVAQWSGKLRQAICEEWRYCDRRSKAEFDDDVTLAVALVDVILGALGVVPVAIIAAILVKKKLARFCACEE